MEAAPCALSARGIVVEHSLAIRLGVHRLERQESPIAAFLVGAIIPAREI